MPRVRCTINSLTPQCEGQATIDGKNYHIPFALPGDTLEIEVSDQHNHGIIKEIIEPSTYRSPPLCEHFASCGGCQLQHANNEFYLDIKQRVISHIIEELDCTDVQILPQYTPGPQTRRRADFKVKTVKGKVSLGFYAPYTHDVISINQCHIIEPIIEQARLKLQTLLSDCKKPGRIEHIQISRFNDSLELHVFVKDKLQQADIEALRRIEHHCNVSRLAISNVNAPADEANIVINNNPELTLAGYSITPPLNCFMQASEAAGNHITQQIIHSLADYNNVADLFCGLGTYSFPLVEAGHYVLAFEGDDDMIMAMNQVIGTYKLESHIKAQSRNLVKRPVTPNQLQHVQAVVLNPPRFGATPQIKTLVQTANIERVIMVSCNPKTFFQDAKRLTQHGYALKVIQLIDQFYWSKHSEIFAIFDKKEGS